MQRFYENFYQPKRQGTKTRYPAQTYKTQGPMEAGNSSGSGDPMPEGLTCTTVESVRMGESRELLRENGYWRCTHASCRHQARDYAALEEHIAQVHAKDQSWWRCVDADCKFRSKTKKALAEHMTECLNWDIEPSAPL